MESSVPLLPDERIDTVNERLRLIQKKHGLTYGTDAFLLAAFIRPQPSAHAVELGGGSGIVSLLLAARNKAKNVTVAEVQPIFADLITRNAALNGLQDRIRVVETDLRNLSTVSNEPIELVFSNPPYLTTDSGRMNLRAEKEIARHEVFGGIADFCACAARLLQTGGRFVTVWRPERLADLFTTLRANRLEPKRMVAVCSDRNEPPFIVLTEAVKDASPALRFLPTTFLYEPALPGMPRRLTPEAERIYNTCSFPDTGSRSR